MNLASVQEATAQLEAAGAKVTASAVIDLIGGSKRDVLPILRQLRDHGADAGTSLPEGAEDPGASPLVPAAAIMPDWRAAAAAWQVVRRAEAMRTMRQASLDAMQVEVDAVMQELLLAERRQQCGFSLAGDGKDHTVIESFRLDQEYSKNGMETRWQRETCARWRSDQHILLPAMALRERYHLAVHACTDAARAVDAAREVFTATRQEAIATAQRRWVFLHYPALAQEEELAAQWEHKGRPEVAAAMRQTAHRTILSHAGESPLWDGEGPGAQQ